MEKNDITAAINDLLASITEDGQKYPALLDSFQIGAISDGYHTFDELYRFRLLYNALLFNTWAKWSLYNVHKSWCHFDGEKCFGGDYFIVAAMLPTGLITNHYKKEDWELFKILELPKSAFEFDGHTSADVEQRITNFIKQS